MAGTPMPIPVWPKPLVSSDMAVGKGDIGALVMPIGGKIIPLRVTNGEGLGVPETIIDALLMLIDEDEGS